MRSTLRTLLVLALTLSLASFVAACGSDDKGGSDSSKSGGGDAASGKTGGSAKAALTSYPDFMDPALSYTQEGWQTLWTVYTGLLTYNHKEGADGSELIPGLAEAMPEVSPDGKTYTLKLRDGLKYSDGKPVKASDFEHTIKRVLNLESGGSSFYLDIQGAEEYAKAGKTKGDISGIETNDQTGEITIKLKDAVGSFPYYLAMDFAGLVPSDTPFENESKNPPPGVGPYKLENVQQSRGFELVRNDSFPAIDGVPKPKLDKITVKVQKNQAQQTQDIINDQLDYALDPPPADQLRQVKTQNKDRYEEFVTNSTYYFFMNQRVAPFDKKEVREAVNYAIDKRSLARLFGGLFQPDCNFLPPGMQGYEKIDPCPWGDPNAAPNVEKAKQLIKEAGATGAKVSVYANDEEPSKPVGEYLTSVLNDIGLKADTKIVEGSVYFATIENQKTKAQIGFLNWFQDFPHPHNFMFLVDPKSIQQTNNQNPGNIDDPKIKSMLAEADKKPIEEAAADYAAVDKYVVEQADVAAYGHRKLANFVSKRVDFKNCTVTHPVYQLDFTQLCLK
jgi:peptide/nickel transport system substrate-binding protein